MKKLFKKVMDKIESHFLSRAGIVFTRISQIQTKELKIKEYNAEVFISNKTLISYGVPEKDIEKNFVWSALKEISHKIGDDLLEEGCLEIGVKLVNGGININASLLCSKPEEPKSKDELCKKIVGDIFVV